MGQSEHLRKRWCRVDPDQNIEELIDLAHRQGSPCSLPEDLVDIIVP
jgi:hypothetical protein